MSKRMSKCNIPLPPKIVRDDESNGKDNKNLSRKRTSRLDVAGSNEKNSLVISNGINRKDKPSSVDPPIIRRESNQAQVNYPAISNSYNNTKYGFVNPINGLTNQDFDPMSSSRRDNPTAMMTGTGIISHEPTKYTKYNSRMGESGLNFGVDNGFRQTTNAYAGIGAPVLKKNYTSDNFNNKPYPMGRGGSQQVSGGRGKGDFNSYFRSSAQAMFGAHAIAMPKIATNHVRAKY